MPKPGILKRMFLKVMYLALKQDSEAPWHAVDRELYVRARRGRFMDSFSHPQVEVGQFSYGFQRESFRPYHPDDRVVIGRFCSLAEGVKFVFGEHRLDGVSTFPLRAVCFDAEPHADARSKGDIKVGNDVWIGANALVLSGVQIGDGAVVAAGAVVARDVPPYAVAGGVPARVIKYRLRPDQIEALLKIQWWSWPVNKIRENLSLFYGDPDDFIGRHLAESNLQDSR
jgi:acetyltransferase-like isoleucine patch superfamily enzyme